MTQPHAKRRGVAPRPSEAHLRMLARLIKRAQVAGNYPEDANKALTLTRVAERVARKAILPVGHQNDAQSPLVQLIRVSKDWFGLGSERRSDGARGLLTCAHRARVVLDEVQAPSVAASRKDIDG